MNHSEAEAVMEDIWRQCTRTAQPELLLVDPRTGEMYRQVSEEAQRFREVFTPVGLRRLFPGLPAVT